MKHFLISLVIMFSHTVLMAQFTDNFADGNFTANPRWSGDSAQFKVNSSLQLQLNASGAGTSMLTASNNLLQDMEWSFWIKLSFAPSDNNMARVYLSSDQSNIKGTLNGYYLKFGENGSNDAIELVKQTGDNHTVLCRGTAGFLSSPFAIRIKVIHTSDGQWKVLVDNQGGINYQFQASGSDNTIVSGSYLGVYCKYTSSNSTKFYFDDFYAGPLIIDTVPPKVKTVSVVSANTITVQFDEAVETASACNANNYSIVSPSLIPDTVVQDNTTLAQIQLTLPQDLVADQTYTLTLSGVKDMAGNTMLPKLIPIVWHRAKAFDILINEIMADPTPTVKLPDAEYIELYNRSSFAVDLKGWALELGSSQKILPDFVLQPQSYVILSDESSRTLLESYEPLVCFSSFVVTNTGGTITLKDNGGRIVHSVAYSDSWYKNDYKKNGGWSLELIDPANPCGESSNWIASEDDSGGTPGRANSVLAANPDLAAPFVYRVAVDDETHITVWFSETCDSVSISDPTTYSINNGIGIPILASLNHPDYRRVQLTLPSPLSAGLIYMLTVMNQVSDCVGNLISNGTQVKFALPAPADSNDIVINELMFNPPDGCADFVEIMNRSSKVLDLRDLVLANYDSLSHTLINYREISSDAFLFMPGDIIVLSTDSASIKKSFHTTNPMGFIDMPSFPTMNNDDGIVALATKAGRLIDLAAYSASMQYPLLTDVKGVSLERISPERSSRDPNNWHSAAATVGYATPAYKNSQFASTIEDQDEIHLSPDIFSPDNDGHDDNLAISYHFDAPGKNITITIFDETGHPVRNLVDHKLCGVSGEFSWDGTTNSRLKAPIGRYIVFAEIFDLNGKIHRIKKLAVLGGKL